MKFLHLSVEEFESLENVEPCQIVLLERNENEKKYQLKSELKKWK